MRKYHKVIVVDGEEEEESSTTLRAPGHAQRYACSRRVHATPGRRAVRVAGYQPTRPSKLMYGRELDTQVIDEKKRVRVRLRGESEVSGRRR